MSSPNRRREIDVMKLYEPVQQAWVLVLIDDTDGDVVGGWQ
jgi:hypothetical protein